MHWTPHIAQGAVINRDPVGDGARFGPISLFTKRNDIDNIRSADQLAELVRLRVSEATARQAAEAALAAAAAERESAREAVEAAARRSVEQAVADTRAATVTLPIPAPPWSRPTPNRIG